MGTYQIITTAEEDELLGAASVRTGRTPQELIDNAFKGWLGQVSNELKTSMLEEKFKSLPDADKEALFKVKAYFDSLPEEERAKIKETLGLP